MWRNLDSLQRQKAALNQVLSLHNEFYQDTRLIWNEKQNLRSSKKAKTSNVFQTNNLLSIIQIG